MAGVAQVQHDEIADVGLVFGDEDMAGHGSLGRAVLRASYTDVICL